MNTKKIIYISLSVVLGLFLSFLVHAIIEIFYINHLLAEEILPEPGSLTHKCFLPAWLYVALLLAGLIGGYLLGCFWWRKIYINKKRDK